MQKVKEGLSDSERNAIERNKSKEGETRKGKHVYAWKKLKKRGNKPRKDECVKRDSKTNF